MRFSLLFFNMIFVSHQDKNGMNNLFVNQKIGKIGYVNKQGDLFYLNNEKKEQKYGTLEVKQNKVFEYKENNKNWCLSTPSRSYISSKGCYYEKPFSTSIYNDFNENFFQVYRNGQIVKDGKDVNIKTNNKVLWTCCHVFDNENVLYMNEENEFSIHHLQHDYEMFHDIYSINSIAHKINVSRRGHFINVYILYPDYGIRVLRFFGGFNNFRSGFFISIPNCRDFSHHYPHLSVITDDGYLKIWNVPHNQKYEMLYSHYYKELKDTILQIIQWNKIIYILKKSSIMEFLLLPI